MKFDPDGPLLVLSPHLDDAVLSCFVLLSDVPGAVVVNVFAGIPPSGTLSLWDRLCGFDDSATAATARLAEDAAAMSRLGVAEVCYLDYLDGLNRDVGDGPDPLDVCRAVEALVPAASLVLAPLAGGPRPNPDHRIVRDAARGFLRGTGPGEDEVPVMLYADVPYCVKGGGWPRLFGGGAPNPPWLARVAREIPEAVGLVAILRKTLSRGERREKLALVKIYRSQFGGLDRRLRERGLMSARSTWEREAYVLLERVPAASPAPLP